MQETVMSMMQENTTIWVFAYGSLLWKPCFHYQTKVVGHIKGFKRRFYQGNTNLRGSVSQPGRVAILVPDEEEVTWGVAFQIKGREHVRQALEHLYVRENSNGGYHTLLRPFHPRPSDVTDGDVTVPSEPFSVITFTATSASPQWLGSADVTTMARQVVSARGDAGTNAEYVLRTAEYVREHIPEDQDQHLFGLERKIRELLAAAALVLHRRRSSTNTHRDHPAAPTLHTVTVPV